MPCFGRKFSHLWRDICIFTQLVMDKLYARCRFMQIFETFQSIQNIFGDISLCSSVVSVIISTTPFLTSASRSLCLRIILEYLVVFRCLQNSCLMKYRRGVQLFFLHAPCIRLVGFVLMQTAGCGFLCILVEHF